MYKNHNSFLHNSDAIALCYIVEFCPEKNINTIRDITLQPLSVYPRVFEVHLSFLLILLISEL